MIDLRIPPDLRRLAARPDLAAAHLRGRVEAARYAEARPHSVAGATAPLRKVPDAARGYESELLHGEGFDVYDIVDGWAWGQASRDGYVGYIPVEALRPGRPAPTHRVVVLRSFVYPVPGIKVPALGYRPYGAQLRIEGQEGEYLRSPDGYLFAAHLAPLASFAADPVREAERFVGIPYLWGGTSSLGLDCSGLVQSVCQACGIAAPRDSDMQEAELGEKLDLGADLHGIMRGDLLFWPGHVALAQDNTRMIHATGAFMAVISEDIVTGVARILAKTGHPIRTIRRFVPPLCPILPKS